VDAVEFLVGHSLGLRGVYTDPDALPLRETLPRIPPLFATSQVIPVEAARFTATIGMCPWCVPN
jgi:hypothetical protein